MHAVQLSKFRHIYGILKSKSGYDCIKPRSARDSNLIKANCTFVAVQWDTPGYGALLVLPARDNPNSEEPSHKEQRLPNNPPLLEPHTSLIQDFDFSPFEDSLLATSDGNCIRLWQIPLEGIQKTTRKPNAEIKNETNSKILGLQFHPTSHNLMLSTHYNHAIKIFDINHHDASILYNKEHKDLVQRTSWDWYGALLATSCKDKNLRVIDPRNDQITHCVLTHESIKGFTLTWLGQRDQIVTAGFSKDGKRQLSAWDLRSFSKPLASLNIGSGSGVITPYHDPTTDIIFLLGKGDTYISYYIIEDTTPFLSYLNEFKMSESQSDISSFPRRVADPTCCEIARFAKLSKDSIKHISFQVPRKNVGTATFHEDLYLVVPSLTPSLTADQWLKGMSKPPILLQTDQIKLPGSTSIYTLRPDKLRREDTHKPHTRPNPISDDDNATQHTLASHTHTFHDNSVYDGCWSDGLFHGPGTLTLTGPNPASYAGSWSFGLRQGHGTLKLLLDDGHSAQLSGTWDSDQLIANSAVYTLDQFSLSSATFSDSGQLVKGRLTLPNGDQYEGDFLDGMKHGQGTWHGSDGSSYTGEYKQDLRHGYGVFTYPNGLKRMGTWIQDTFTTS